MQIIIPIEQIEELVTIKKLIESGDEPANALELQNRMAELQSEMFRLEVNNRKLSSLQNGNANGNESISSSESNTSDH